MTSPHLPPAPGTPPSSLTHAAPGKQHPLLIAAAIAVILFCLVGTAAIMGWIPSSFGGKAASTQLSDFDKAALASRLAQDERNPSQLGLTSTDAALSAQRYASVQPEPVRKPAAAPVRTVTQPERMAQAEQAAPARGWCGNCGNIESVREIKQRAQGSGLGAAGGAVLGGLLGNQIGGGTGRQLATVAGAVGGAVVGNQVEGNMKASRSYEIRVRLDDGSARTFSQQSAAGWRTGDRVKVVNGALRSVH